MKKYGSLTYTTYTIWSGTLLMLVFLPGLLHNIMLARRAATLSVIYLGIFPTVISYFSLAYVTSVVGSSKATNFLYVIPVVSFIISWIWFGIAPSLNAVISGMVILLGIVTTQQRNGLFIRNPGA
ncbi:MAG: DMT family transporter [Firmicutes bacterium]|nr:DMT family transporter [Bacillota bacterium]